MPNSVKLLDLEHDCVGEQTTPRMTRRVFVRTPCTERPAIPLTRGAREMSLYKMAWREEAVKTVVASYPWLREVPEMQDDELSILVSIL